jgi:large subunit ribosomal protein L30
MSDKTVTIKYVKSVIGYDANQKGTIKALGLKKLGQIVTRPDSPQLRGMINTIKHLVEVK